MIHATRRGKERDSAQFVDVIIFMLLSNKSQKKWRKHTGKSSANSEFTLTTCQKKKEEEKRRRKVGVEWRGKKKGEEKYQSTSNGALDERLESSLHLLKQHAVVGAEARGRGEYEREKVEIKTVKK